MGSAQVPESHSDLLTKQGFAHLSTMGASGWPQSTPMWYGWDGDHLLFSTLKRRQKYQNLRRNPRVAVSISDPDNPYRYLQIRGTASLTEEAGEGGLIDSLVDKYIGRQVYLWDEPGAERVIVKVKIVSVSCYG